MHSHVVVGLAFGDEGKGSWVDHLCRRHKINTIVRFNGGAQALHHVTTEAGVTHGFSQFGSHSFIPGAKTMLSRYMLVEPVQLMFEAEDLVKKGVTAPLRRLYISDLAPIIPFTNVLLNQIMELARGNERHGSCGLGIGLTQRDIDQGDKPVIRAGDLKDRISLVAKLREHLDLTLREVKGYHGAAESQQYKYLCEEFENFLPKYVDIYCELGRVTNIVPEAAFLSTLRRTPAVFEGAQGALLDQSQGTFPYCTRSTTTSINAQTLLSEAGFTGDVTRHGLLRAYGTRHGAGPFVTEDINLDIPQCDNSTGQWQGQFRKGWFDVVAARTALQFSEVDALVLTNLDRLDGLSELWVATRYGGLGRQFYHRRKNRLVTASNYDHSKRRTDALHTAKPVYESMSGYADEHDPHQEGYIQFLEGKIGRQINALSRRKDHHKVYRT
ncbi:MAG: adenylosuccinate synthase [Patiriisocius sp.]|jgi:adenylosuccinate synthase